jgi:hypothetical protein
LHALYRKIDSPWRCGEGRFRTFISLSAAAPRLQPSCPFFAHAASANVVKLQQSGDPKFEKNRLEAFSDGVIAIIVTIIVLELKPPPKAQWSALVELTPVFSSCVLSFMYVAINWNNHHHMLQMVRRVNGAIL